MFNRKESLPLREAEDKNKMTMETASSFHNDWRSPRKQEDGSYEPRDKALIRKDGKEKWVNKKDIGNYEVLKEQDIANTDFKDLDPHWQKENLEAAKVAVDLVSSHEGEFDERFIEEASSKVHDEWLKRNDWVFNKDYGNPVLAKPYRGLPEEEKDKDRAQIKKAIEVVKE